MAAFIVLLSHIGGILLIPMKEMPHQEKNWVQLFYSFLAGFAHESVIVFFVISGYFVGGSLLKDFTNNKLDVVLYYVKRLTRLWVVLIPALLLSFGFNKIFYKISPIVYDTRHDNFLNAHTFISNIFFLQNVISGSYGSNEPLWSLFNEFWYYNLFLLVILFCANKNSRKRLIFLSLILLMIFTLTTYQFSHAWFLPYFIIWLLGVLASGMNNLGIIKTLKYNVLLFLAYSVIARVSLGTSLHGTTLVSFFNDLICAILFTRVIIAMKGDDSLRRPIGGSVNSIMAGFSYTLYCVHIPFTLAFSSVMLYFFNIGHRMYAKGPFEWGIVVVCVMLNLLFAYLFSLLTESNTNKYKNTIYSFLKKKFVSV
jgi:peptidoglycan/LPS O-acetylase OafA/YrhL